jgi:hypothetical protein
MECGARGPLEEEVLLPAFDQNGESVEQIIPRHGMSGMADRQPASLSQLEWIIATSSRSHRAVLG